MSYSWDIRRLFETGVEKNFEYMVLWAAKNSDDIQAQYCLSGELTAVLASRGKTALEVYDLQSEFNQQLQQGRCWSVPTNTSSLPSPSGPVELPVELSI